MNQQTHIKELVRSILAKNPIYLDTETTGTGKKDEIISIGIVDTDGTVLLDTLVKPTIPISPSSTCIHGITDADVANAPTFAEVTPTLRATVKKRDVVIYNTGFDIRMLIQSARANHIRRVFIPKMHCAMKIYSKFYGEQNHCSYHWHKLSNAALYCQIPVPDNLHDAVVDSQLTRQVFNYMAK